MLRPMLSRRRVIEGIGAGCLAAALPGVAFFPRVAAATMARAVSLPQLVGLSQYALVGAATEAYSRWESVGASRRIVTYVQVLVTQPIDGRPPPETTLMLRTLGGRVGDIGQLVHGEAKFELDAPAVVFLAPDSDGVLGVTAMAQGHYPLSRGSRDVVRLLASPNMPSLTQVQGSAVERLVQKTVLEAESMVSDIMHDH